MSDVLIRKPLLVDVAKYKGYANAVIDLVININMVSYIVTVNDEKYRCHYIEFITVGGPVRANFVNRETRDAAFQDLSKYFN